MGVALTHATDANWINNGYTNVVLPIDATNFINNAGGNVSVFSSPTPFDTSNTRNFTNAGTMSGSVGFRFDNAPRDSAGNLFAPRKLAANFLNKNSGVITATDGFVYSDYVLPPKNVSYLLVHATNIVNQGVLTVGAGGLLQLVGTNVNISRSGLQVATIAGTGSFNGRTNFTPDVGITDNYWEQTNDTFAVSGIHSAFGPFSFVSSPPHDVISAGFGGTLTTTVGFDLNNTNYGYAIAANKQSLGGTNEFRQAVFVRTSSSNVTARVRFVPSANPTNLFSAVEVQISVVESNVVTQAVQTNSVYFYDTLASATNRGLLPNINTRNTTKTSRPANYNLSRQPVFQFFNGADGNETYQPDFLFGNNFVAVRSYGNYAGYSATIDNLDSRPPVLGSDPTNYPGRVEIVADQLDMNRARIRTEGLLSIKANHIISSANAVIDSENLSYTLSTTNETLVVESLMKDSVNRFRGDLVAWSGVWTNAYPPNSTNPTFVNLHALIIDANVLLDKYPVNVSQLDAKATNVVIRDNATLGNKFLIQSESLTLDGNITLVNNLQNWEQTLAPTLKYFTNNGSLSIPNEAHFGDEGITPYRTFVNHGDISAIGQIIRSDYAEITGYHSAFASFSMQATNGQINGGQIFAGGGVTLAGNSLVLNQATIDCSSTLVLNLTNSLSDNGATSSNNITVGDGFIQVTKPTTGDLLGTTLETIAPNFALVTHYWAGRDDGVNNSGYSNNTALGKLVLTPVGNDQLFEFAGTGTANGLYVDRLDLSQLSDYTNQIQIDSNLKIYYAAASLAASALPTNGMSAEAFLDGKFGGRLRWVPSFSGPNSSTNVTINGNQTITVNLALRKSMTIDSDADGIVNGLDASPFDGVKITAIKRNSNPAGYLLTWTAAPNSLYHVEARTNLTTAAWSKLFDTTSTNTVTGPYSVLDTNTAPAGVTRYYRVTYSPN